MALATTDELALYLQQTVNEDVAELVLELAENAIAAEFTGSTIPTPAPVRAKGICLAVAARAYVNPAGLQSDSIDDYTRRFGPVYLTDDERTALTSKPGSNGLWTLPTTRGDELDTRWVYDQYADGTLNGGDPIPFERTTLP